MSISATSSADAAQIASFTAKVKAASDEAILQVPDLTASGLTQAAALATQVRDALAQPLHDLQVLCQALTDEANRPA